MSRIPFILKEILNHILIPVSEKTGWVLTSPTIAVLFLTKRCNSRCKICEYWKNDCFDDELTTQQWFDVIHRLKQAGVKIINFTADGEILTRKDCFKIMNYAKKLGFLLTVNTNGLLLNRYADRFIELDPLQIQISLDVFDDESYNEIRGVPNGFSKVKHGILYLKEKGITRISLGSVLTKDNIDALPVIQNFAAENGFSYRITAFQFQGFNVDNRNLREFYQKKIFTSKLNSVIKHLLIRPVNNTSTYLNAIKNYYLQKKYHPLDCIVGYYKIFILPDGTVSLCNIMRNKAIIGNICQQTFLTDMWKGKQAQIIRKKIKEKNCPSCWLSCFAEDNIRFSPPHFFRQIPYFFKKLLRLLR